MRKQITRPSTLATSRTLDGLDTMITLVRELTPVSSVAELRDALNRSVRWLLPSPDIAILRVSQSAWEAVIGPKDVQDRISQYSWTPLVADGETIGMLGLGTPAAGGPSGKTAEAATTLLAMIAQNLLTIDMLRHESVRDGLTSCFTRAYGMGVLEANLRRAKRTGYPVSILMIDVDDFKRINDRYGHGPGDSVLMAIAKELHGILRQSDVRCRIGGDEFLVILPETRLEDAERVAESVRHAIEGIVVSSIRGKVRITASIGVATASCDEPVDVPRLVDRADVALYRAKQTGRNSVQACAFSGGRLRHAGLRIAAQQPA